MTDLDLLAPADLPAPAGYSHVAALGPGRRLVAGLFRPDLLIEIEAVAAVAA